MNCSELDGLLCDYIDGALGEADKARVEGHLEGCAACAELARDASGAVAFLGRVAEIEPPAELVTRILFQIPSRRAACERRGGLRAWLGRAFEPVLQPRFAMGMAMTILSFAMMGRFAGIEIRQLKPADLQPAKVWAVLDNKVHRAWERAVKYYESLRFVYEIQSRLREWQEQSEAQAETQPAEPGQPQTDPSGAVAQPGEGEQGRATK